MRAAGITVIMPVRNEAQYLPHVLERIERQNVDRARLFVVVADAGSTDGSDAIVQEWFERSDVRGCVVPNPLGTIPGGLNAALRVAGIDDIIVRLDARTVCEETYIAQAVEALERAPSDVACVGCVACPLPATTFEKRVVEALYTNPMGLGGTSGSVLPEIREADSVYLGTWRPGVLQRVGGFNETMEANEDGEIAARLRHAGYRILRVPLPCRFVIKRGVAGAIRQWNRYGYFRAKMLQRNPRFVRLRHIASPLALVLATALAISPFRIALVPLAALYAFAVYSRRAAGEPFALTLATIAFFPLLQASFALGMFAGIATGKGRDWPPASRPASTVEMQS